MKTQAEHPESRKGGRRTSNVEKLFPPEAVWGRRKSQVEELSTPEHGWGRRTSLCDGRRHNGGSLESTQQRTSEVFLLYQHIVFFTSATPLIHAHAGQKWSEHEWYNRVDAKQPNDVKAIRGQNSTESGEQLTQGSKKKAYNVHNHTTGWYNETFTDPADKPFIFQD